MNLFTHQHLITESKLTQELNSMNFSKPKPQGPEEVKDDFGEEKVARLSKARKCVQNFNRKT